jgi:hypothetical protein
MADGSLSSFISSASKRGVKLAGKQKKALTKAIQQSGKKGGGKKITAKELTAGRKAFNKGGGSDYLASVGRTYNPRKLTGSARKVLERKGFARDESGYYTKPGSITQSAIDKARGAGYSDEDIRATLAKDFSKRTLDDQVGKYLGEGGGYKKNDVTGLWEKQEVTGGSTTIPTPSGVTGTPGPYAGINPDDAQGAFPSEIDYATTVDPYKIDAKSRERIARLQQATDLIGKRMGYSTQFDIERLGRLKGIQEANIQQANYLYNLIPSAF